eukprot:4020881-Pleurochrysis_carterae.AAC.1
MASRSVALDAVIRFHHAQNADSLFTTSSALSSRSCPAPPIQVEAVLNKLAADPCSHSKDPIPATDKRE